MEEKELLDMITCFEKKNNQFNTDPEELEVSRKKLENIREQRIKGSIYDQG